jgi:hypothetical protein
MEFVHFLVCACLEYPGLATFFPVDTLYGRGSQEVKVTPHIFCYYQDIQIQYKLYAALMLYQ